MRRILLILLFLPAASAPSDFTSFDPEFDALIGVGNAVAKPATGFQFVEGPVWNPGSGVLVFSDINANRMVQFTPGGAASDFRNPSNKANGNTRDVLGRLLSCEQTTRGVSRAATDASAPVALISTTSDGKKFNAPNDIAVKSDGTVWFTDPDYGIPGPKEQAGNYVYRWTPDANGTTGTVATMITTIEEPNGICFSPDESKLYVSDTGAAHHILVYTVGANNAITLDKEFAVITPGVPDGIRCDQAGRIFSSAGDGVHVYRADGTLIGTINVPETPTNVCFGGADGQTLFITAQTSLYSVALNTLGAGVAGGNPIHGGGGGGGGGGCGLIGLEVLLLSVLRRARSRPASR